MTDPGLPGIEWIWLLHDDCEPAPETLERLLRAASRDRSVVVLGPKVLDGQDRRTLREVGVSIDRAGRRVTGIEPGEIDQGQHDHNRAVIAVGSAGMLVRRDVWDQLGGFDPRLRLFRDDVDFCWRVQAAGYRVQVVTDAVLYHRELRRGGAGPTEATEDGIAAARPAQRALCARRQPAAADHAPHRRRARRRLAHARPPTSLLTKQLDLAARAGLRGRRAARAPGPALAGPPSARRGRPRGLCRGPDLHPARAHAVAARGEGIAGLISDGPPQASGGMHQAAPKNRKKTSSSSTRSRAVRRIIGNPGVQLFSALLVVALIAERRLLGTSPLGGGALVPAWGGASAPVAGVPRGLPRGRSRIHRVRPAVPGGRRGARHRARRPGLAGGGRPAARLRAAGRADRLPGDAPAGHGHRRAGAGWRRPTRCCPSPPAPSRRAASAPRSRSPLLPLIGISAAPDARPHRREQARRAAWATGLLIAVAAAFAPLLWVLGAVFASRPRRRLVRQQGWGRWLAQSARLTRRSSSPLPFFVLFPWSLHLLASPSAFFTEAGVQPSGLTTVALRPSALLALSPGGPGLPPVWVTVGLGLAVLAALLPTAAHRW